MLVVLRLFACKSPTATRLAQPLFTFPVLLACAASLSSTLAAGQSPDFMGSATCASSNCHGNAAPVAESRVLRNEFVTWYRHDSHAKAFSVLTNEQSKRIAHNLGITDAAKEPQCLACHSTFVSDSARRGPKFRTEDGVSCESCHGASSAWLAPHVESGATHARNVTLGMTDLRAATVKTQLCLGCHLGNDEKNVTHRLIGAGHPRLTFEIDTFESVMPRHWMLANKDEKDRKAYQPASAWLAGQVTQATERTKALYSKTRSHAGLMPEFANLHCYACHHSLSQKQYESRDYGGKPGELNLNTSELWILSKALAPLDASKANKLASQISALREAYGKEDSATTSKAIVDTLTKEIMPLVNGRTLSVQEQNQIFDQLVNASHQNLQYETAEQIAMGAAAIAASESDTPAKKEAVQELYRVLEDPNTFDPRLFRKPKARK